MGAKSICKRIMDIEEDDALYLLCTLSDSAGFFSTKRKLLYIVRDEENNLHESIETEFLVLHTHIRISSVKNAATFPDDDYNVLLYKGSMDDSNIESFVQLCDIHARATNCLRFREFFYSLIDLFKLPTEQEYKNAIGLYGELKLMQIAFEKYNTDISEMWHKSGSYSHFDFSSSRFSIEVKTIVGNDATVMLKHQQVFGDTPCVLAVMNCVQVDTGEALIELVSDLQHTESAFEGINYAINIATEQKRISKSDFSNLRFRMVKFSLYKADTINPFGSLPINVSDLSYRLDLSDAAPLPVSTFFSVFQCLIQ